MAIRTREEIMNQLQTVLGDNVSDEALGLIQDVSDTISNDHSAERITELETQLQDQDKAWRQKYRDAFFSGNADESIREEEDDTSKVPTRYEDLFTIN